jgi:pyruvate/2-oxoglutarate dehydrogenase complex dihydrolipoamide acyltransferase (E2) component
MKKCFSVVAVAAACFVAGCSSSTTQSASDTSVDTTVSTASPVGSDVVVPDTGTFDTGTSDTAVEVTVAAPKPAVGKVDVPPGQSTDDFEGAASDVTTETCKLDGDQWTIDGSVTNKSGSDASYRIYVAMNKKGTTETVALIQVNASVANDKTEKWSTAAAVTDTDLVCVLRVERTKKK